MDIDGDGSFLMNCQELATAAIERMDIKMFILNNQHLGMVVQWEDRFYKVPSATPRIMCCEDRSGTAIQSTLELHPVPANIAAQCCDCAEW